MYILGPSDWLKGGQSEWRLGFFFSIIRGGALSHVDEWDEVCSSGCFWQPSQKASLMKKMTCGGGQTRKPLGPGAELCSKCSWIAWLWGKLVFILFAAQSYMLFSLGSEDTVSLQLDQKTVGKEQVWVRGWNKDMCQERKQAEWREDSKDSRTALEELKSHWKQWRADLALWKIKTAVLIIFF